ncbi:MAG: amino acid adenylation domain-containing protein, partial [Gemmatimonadetes bacterium]|nr:amino acid adenylation domain-containing protein [Gemmatimonadota bacterium]
ATGDRVRWRADGELEFLGRADFQVKVRGFRIEPGEVEGVLRAHPSVANAVVLARGAQGGRRLVGYVAAAAGANPASAELAAWVRQRLPEYMVPAAFVVLDALPATASGKIDRGALPDPEWADAARPFVSPRTPVEAAVAHVWSAVLGVDAVGAEDDFFALGGHSLLATRVVVRMREGFGADLPLRALFEAPTVAGVAARIAADAQAAARVADAWARLRAGGSPDPLDRIPPRDPAAPAPLSFAQERLWFLAQLEPGSTAYNMPFALRLAGALDAAALERALGTVVARHQALRTVFRAGDGGPEQVIVPAGAVDLPADDLSGLDAAAREAEARRRAQAEFHLPFDLSAGPLYRFALLRLAAEENVLLLTFHHAVMDGWSMDVLYRELGALYGAFARGRAAELPPLPVQYADFAAWQRAWLEGGVMDAQAAFWRERMAGAPAVLDLPTDRPRPAAMPRRAERVRTRLPAELWTRIESLARAEGATPFMVLLAAVQALLARHAGQDDVVVGTPVAGRTRGETEGMIGMFVNAVALRTDVSGNPAFRALLARVRETALGAFAHQDVPFERLVAELATGRALNRAPVFQVMLTVQNADEGAPALPGLRTELLPSDQGHAKLDLLLNVRHRADGVHAAIEYAAELWDAATMDRMLGHLAALLQGALARPELPVLDLPMLGEAERRTLLAWSRTPAADPPGETALAVFQAQAARTPDALAVVGGAEQVTFAALHARANRLANHLRGLGIGTEDRVGVCLARTPELIVALLAAMKAGAAYVPLDPAYPPGRIDQVLQDAGARVLVTTAELARGLSIPTGVVVVEVDQDARAIASASADAPAVSLDAENLAHVIYTSGSTGRPKGVMIRHGAVASFLRWMHGRFPMAPGERVVGSTSVSFDVSVAEIHFALGCGATLVLVENALSLAEPGAMAGAVQASMVPGAAAELLRLGALPGTLRRLNLAGEALAPDLARDLYAAGVPEVHDLYGPTEDTTYATHAHVARGVVRNTLGRPLGGRAAYVLDARLRPAPIGAPGEIWLAGRGLARGYLGQPARTAERFLPDPFAGEPGARMYRSGDRGRWMPSGTLEYLGRADFQVKVRGFRIEPGEIEAALREHPRVRGAAVVATQEDGGSVRLTAYVTPSAGVHPTAAELKAHLSARLPEWMVPGAVMVMDAFPPTPSGKLDRAALPRPQAEAAAEHTPPRTGDEARLAAIFAEVLRRDRVGVHDDFFAIGGHSLLATRVVARIREAFGVDVPLRAVFERPTVAGMAAVVQAGAAAAPESIDILGRGTAQRLVDRVDELSEEEMDRLLATLSLDGDL